MDEQIEVSHRGHEGVEDTDSEGSPAGEWLGEIELRVGIIVIVLVKELDVAVIDQLRYHRDVSSVHRAFPLEDNGRAERGEDVGNN